MNKFAQCLFFFVSIAMCVSGCGRGVAPIVLPIKDSCSGSAISGVLQDSLSHEAIIQAWVVVESGSFVAATKNYNFTASQETSPDMTGGFGLCVSTLALPAVLIAVALDASGKAYPPFATVVSAAKDLGVIPMGGCTLTCGLDNQEQTSRPATISGLVVTSPSSQAGTITPHYAIPALDGSGSIWDLLMPVLNSSQQVTFMTAQAGCAGTTGLCSSYMFLLPSQRPFVLAHGQFTQDVGPPVYSIDSSLKNASACATSHVAIFTQADGKPLTAAPGAVLAAANTLFSHCD